MIGIYRNIILLFVPMLLSIGFGQDCDENMFWSDCGLPFYCNSTCLNPDPLPECDDYCEIGCFCNEGYIFSDDTYSECILMENCSELITAPGDECILDDGSIGFYDCELCCWDVGLLSWIGDGYCDHFGGCAWEGPQFDCFELGYDCGDCNADWDGYDPSGLCAECLAGDVNYDSTLNVLDIVLLITFILEGEYDYCGDVNADGLLDILDIVIIVNILMLTPY